MQDDFAAVCWAGGESDWCGYGWSDRGRAHLRGHEGQADRPPRDAPPAERKVFQIILLPAHAQADSDDDEEVEKQNSRIDREPAVHGALRWQRIAEPQRGFSCGNDE